MNTNMNTNMNTQTNTTGSDFERSESRFASFLRGAVMCALMVGAVLVGSGMNREGTLVKDANAAATSPDTSLVGYFPAQFPAPKGEAEPHIEAF